MRFGNSVAMRIEELLREQLEEIGVDPVELEPHEIAENMHCDIWPDQTMVYNWKGTPLLRVVPERHEDGSIDWRMFTSEDHEVEGVSEDEDEAQGIVQ